ncbi:MAG: DNA/RNA nuclease SfsA [Candidatus Thorarchaeota archaeon]|nr:MAG: DNA/RNA nuclease SfsA [Candidatus Thorarchaeota archaeon]
MVSSPKRVRIGKFIERPNRFLARVEIDGQIEEVFVPNPGRMYELMIPGKQVYIRDNSAPHRKTSFDMIGIYHDGVLISLDSNLPNRFMRALLETNQLTCFTGYSKVIPEPRVYGGRFDFLLEGENKRTFVEVKSCTLVVKRRVLFPDAPTARGARHMKHLAHALTSGDVDAAAVVFVIQRPDADIFSPHDGNDPIFGDALREAHNQGVQIIPLLTKVIDWNLVLVKKIPYDLGPLDAKYYD